jgi:large subunit ribosomal protein L1
MAKHGKKYTEAIAKVDRTREYPPADAVALVKGLKFSKFDESVEVHVRTGLNVRHADEQLRGTVALPHGLGKEVKIAVFAKGDKAREAEEAGADIVGAEDLLEAIQGGMLDFDIAIATPDMMPLVGRLGRVLGPRGLMPNPKTGTVTMDVGRAVTEFKGGRVEYRTDRYGNIHVPIGKVSFTPEKLLENFTAVVDELNRAKPAAAKGRYMKKIVLSTTHGPGVKVDPGRLGAEVK